MALDEDIGELVAVSSLSCELDGAPVRSVFNGLELWSNRFHATVFEQASERPSASVPNDLVGPLISPHSGTPIEWDARTGVGSLHVGAPTGGGGSEVLHVGEVVFVPALPADASRLAWWAWRRMRW